LFSIFIARVAWSAQSPTLVITAPTSGAIFSSGDTITVEVQPSTGSTFTSGIAVIGTNPLGTAGPLTTAPFEFTLSIPSDATPGPYQITAVGSAKKQLVVSPTTTIYVETDVAINALSAEPKSITLLSIGEQVPVRIVGTLADGNNVDLTESSKLTFASTDSTVAALPQPGVVISVGPGTTTITATYAGSSPISVPVAVTPVLMPTPTSLDFGSKQRHRSSTAQPVTLVNMLTYPLTILQVVTSGTFTQTNNCISKHKTSGVLSPGDQCAVSVKFKPKKIGTQIGVLSISTGATSAPTIVSLTGMGVSH
jgi:hypothetical protein